MSEAMLDVREMPKPEAYRLRTEQLDAVCEGVGDSIAIMSTRACLLHQAFGHLERSSCGWHGLQRPPEQAEAE